MTEQEDPSQFQERFNKIKALNFRQQREDRLKRQILQILYRQTVLKPQTKHHISLYCKVFKAFMIYDLQLDRFYQSLSQVYQRILLKTHFAAMRKFLELRQSERSQKIEQIIKLRKKRVVNILKEVHQKIKVHKKRQVYKQIYAKQDNFNVQRTLDRYNLADRFIEPLKNKTANLFDSRRSSHSLYSGLDRTSQRKYAPIKLVPQLPPLISVQQNKRQAHSIDTNYQATLLLNEKQVAESKKIESNSKNSANSKVSPQKLSMVDSRHKQDQQKQIQSKSSNMKLQKDKILALLSQVYITSWLQMSDIIEDYTKSTLKSQSLLNEKNSVSRSQHVLQKIASLP